MPPSMFRCRHRHKPKHRHIDNEDDGDDDGDDGGTKMTMTMTTMRQENVDTHPSPRRSTRTTERRQCKRTHHEAGKDRRSLRSKKRKNRIKE